MTSDKSTIAIMEEEILVRYARLPIDKLRFLRYNPRVYATIREKENFSDLTPDEQQLCIYEGLLKEPSVKNLIPEIQRDGGLQDPIIVRHDTWEVIEGNSRLAAYRKLSRGNPDDDRWTHINCAVATKLTEDQQTRLLGQAHLHGRTEWSPYAKALYFFRWVKEEEKDVSILAKLSGISKAEIMKNVKAIELMRENSDNISSKFSHYDNLVRSRRISSTIKDDGSLRNTLLSQIKTKAFTAREMRDYLPTIIDKPKIFRKYVNEDINLHDAFERAKISDTEQRLKRIHDSLDDIEMGDLESLERNQLRSIEQVVKKIRRRLESVSKMVTKLLDQTNGWTQ